MYDLLKSDVPEGTKYKLVYTFDQVLSLDLLKKEDKLHDRHDAIMLKIEQRNNAKKNKDYVLADKIRDELLNEGIVLKDTREGTIYEIL